MFGTATLSVADGFTHRDGRRVRDREAQFGIAWNTVRRPPKAGDDRRTPAMSRALRRLRHRLARTSSITAARRHPGNKMPLAKRGGVRRQPKSTRIGTTRNCRKVISTKKCALAPSVGRATSWARPARPRPRMSRLVRWAAASSVAARQSTRFQDIQPSGAGIGLHLGHMGIEELWARRHRRLVVRGMKSAQGDTCINTTGIAVEVVDEWETIVRSES